jgi:hypothetical protein
MIKSYYIMPGHVGHGARVFLHESAIRSMLKDTHCTLDQLPWKGETTNPIANVLREHALWGGADRCEGEWWGYETTADLVTQERALFLIEQVLQEQGFDQWEKPPWEGGGLDI